MEFIQEYGGAIVFMLAVVCLIAVTIRSKIKNKSSCGSGCGSGCNSCRKN